MTASRVRRNTSVRDLLSSFTALQALSMVMSDSRSEDDILELAAAALPSLSRDCRAHAAWLDGTWRSVPSVQARYGGRTDLEDRIASLGSAGGVLESGAPGWRCAFPLLSRGGVSGYLIVGSPEPPPAHEWTLIQALAQHTGAALATRRVLARERAARARIADEQDTLHRVAALVAQAAPPEDVFAAVAAEAGRLLETDFAMMSRYDDRGRAMVVGSWTRGGDSPPVAVGTQLAREATSVHTIVFQTSGPARTDGRDTSGHAALLAHQTGVRSFVGVPIQIEGQLWGLIGVASRGPDPLPAETEAWLTGFTELVAAAIANAQARVELRGIAEEQAALRRVATLVARAASPEEVFAKVVDEVGQVLSADVAVLARYEDDGTRTVLAAWSHTGDLPVAIGTRQALDGRNVISLVFETGRPVRLDDDTDVSGRIGDAVREPGTHVSVGAPIHVEGRLWGVVSVGSRSAPLPGDAETRLAGFAELVGTAVANAEAKTALTASRARIVAAADTARHRIERDLHDGAQQRLVSVALQLRAAQAAVPPFAGALAAHLEELADGLTGAIEELQEIARGIHPGALGRGGLSPALRTLARRSAVPVRLDVGIDRRLPAQIELAAYYVVAEALTNATKHGKASAIDVEVVEHDGVLRVCVRDDGQGGADVTRGSGLVGLTDRVETLGGQISLHSPPGEGTRLEIELPLDAGGGAVGPSDSAL